MCKIMPKEQGVPEISGCLRQRGLYIWECPLLQSVTRCKGPAKKMFLEFFPMIPNSYPSWEFFKQVKCCWSNHFAFQKASSFVIDDEEFCWVRCPPIH
jgi:hypothetical protein